MSHHIYQTRAFVIDTKDQGEANKLITLFTEDLGLILVAAQGVRHLKSKLRSAIQDLSFSKVSVVRGREVWRLTNGEKLISLYDKRIPMAVRRLMASVLAFIKRLSPGEARHEELFNSLSKFCAFCMEKKEFLSGPEARERLGLLALLAELRTLHLLGYGTDDAAIKKFLTADEWTEELINTAADHERVMRRHIEEALRSSHL